MPKKVWCDPQNLYYYSNWMIVLKLIVYISIFVGKLSQHPILSWKVNWISFLKKGKLNWLFLSCIGVKGKAIPWNEIFSWEAMQGRDNKIWVLLTTNFVKCTNQWEFVRLWLMLQSEAKKKRELTMCMVVKKKWGFVVNAIKKKNSV